MGLADQIGDDWERQKREYRERVREAADFLASRIRERITPGPPSHRGDPPRSESGRLREGIRAEDTPEGARVVSDAPYSHYVDRIRPFFYATIEQYRNWVENHLRTKKL